MAASAASADAKARRAEALQEYYYLEGVVDGFDARSLQIKSWSVTVSAATIGVAFVERQAALLILAAVSAFVFWYIDAMWKEFQRVAMDRAKDIEKNLARPEMTYAGPGIASHFDDNLRWRSNLPRFFEVFFYRNTMLPHIMIVLAGLVLYADSQNLVRWGLWPTDTTPTSQLTLSTR